MNLKWKRAIILSVFLVAFALFFYFRPDHYLNFDTLKEYRYQLLEWTQQHYFAMVFGFIFIYVMAVALSIPGAVFLTLAGGFLFGIFWGTLYVVLGATIGAILLFLLVQTALGSHLAQRADSWMLRLKEGFAENAFNYLLTLRLIPLFPFWLVNIGAAVLNVSLRTFIAATLLGIIPGSLVYVMLGNSLGYLFSHNKQPDLSIILTWPILLPLLALALMALLPVAYKKYKRKP